MRLVVLAEDFYPNTSGGAHTRWRFCQLAAERGHDITVFTSRERGLTKSEVVDDVEIRRPFRVKSEEKPVYAPISVLTRIVASILLFGYICWWIRDQDVNGLHSASHLTHWIGKALSVLHDLPLVSFVGYTPSVVADPKVTPKLLLERANFRLFMGQTIFCRTPHTKDVIKRYTNAKVEILHGILNRERITSAISEMNPSQKRANLNVGKDDTLLVSVGRLVPIKNPVGAIKVLSELPNEYTLVIIGDGDGRESVEQAAREHGVEDRVRICGTLPHEEALETIAVADALVFPSHVESYGAVVFEALTLNTTVFARPVGAVPAVEHPRLYVGTLDEFPRLISETMINSPAELDTETLERFSIEQYTDGLLNAFEGQTAPTIGGL